jgi:hypothetical protein
LAYRIAGREADAQKAAEALDNARKKEDKKANPLNMWADGYLQLAANEGLISQQDLTDALNQDQTTLTETSFYRGAPSAHRPVYYIYSQNVIISPV